MMIFDMLFSIYRCQSSHEHGQLRLELAVPIAPLAARKGKGARRLPLQITTDLNQVV